MAIVAEKDSLYLLPDLGYHYVSSEWFNIVLNHNRISHDDDTIEIFIKDNYLSIKYKDYTNFDWEIFNKYNKESTFSKMLRRYNTKIKYIPYSDFSLISFKFGEKFENIAFKSFKVSDLMGGLYYTDMTFNNCSNHNSFDKFEVEKEIYKAAYVIIFETLLNIVQHNYRRHGLIEADEINYLDMLINKGGVAV